MGIAPTDAERTVGKQDDQDNKGGCAGFHSTISAFQETNAAAIVEAAIQPAVTNS
jgi:hypothetical protein